MKLFFKEISHHGIHVLTRHIAGHLDGYIVLFYTKYVKMNELMFFQNISHLQNCVCEWVNVNSTLLI